MKKLCKKCNKILEIENFSVCSRNPDGFKNICKDCQKYSAAVYYKQHKSQIIEQVQEWQAENKEKVNEIKKRWSRKNKPNEK